MNMSYKTLLLLLLGALVLFGLAVWFIPPVSESEPIPVTNFEECVAAGNPVMESYPRQCRAGDQNFVEEIGNELEVSDLIRVNSPRPGDAIQNPLRITGEARGTWYFEASFPVVLVNWDGLTIAEGHAEALGEWMTESFVPFVSTLHFTLATSTPSNRATLILKKDNPSGLPENDKSFEIPVYL
jgi:hypothetical protein